MRRSIATLAGYLSLIVICATVASPDLRAQRPEESDSVFGSFHGMVLFDEMTDERLSGFGNDGVEAGGLALLGYCGGRRRPGTASIVVILGGFMGGDRNDRVRVQYRFDDEPAGREENWDLSRNGQMAFGSARFAATFMDRAPTAKRVLLRITDPFDGEVLTEEFATDGFSDVLQYLGCVGLAAPG